MSMMKEQEEAIAQQISAGLLGQPGCGNMLQKPFWLRTLAVDTSCCFQLTSSA
jgi:hypothetical protein